MEKQSVKRFSDFSDEKIIEGEKIRLDEIINKEIIITDYDIKGTKFSDNKSGKCLTLQFEIERMTRVIFTGSDVLIKQIEKYKEHIPFLTVIKKIKRYYTFS